MLIYLDRCSLQRPFDDQSQYRVMVEADAILAVVALCESGRVDLASSVALAYENERNPYPDRQARITELLGRAARFVVLSPEVEHQASSFVQAGLKPLDALHLACALEAKADYFCTCDDRLLKRARLIYRGSTKILSPLELIMEIEP